MSHTIFISFSTENQLQADRVCNYLEQNGVKCWISSRDCRDSHMTAIPDAIEACKYLVLIASPQSAESPWVPDEINLAKTKKKILVPFDIVKFEYPKEWWMLGTSQRINAYSDFDNALMQLLERVGGQVKVSNQETPQKQNSESFTSSQGNAALEGVDDRNNTIPETSPQPEKKEFVLLKKGIASINSDNTIIDLKDSKLPVDIRCRRDDLFSKFSTYYNISLTYLEGSQLTIVNKENGMESKLNYNNPYLGYDISSVSRDFGRKKPQNVLLFFDTYKLQLVSPSELYHNTDKITFSETEVKKSIKIDASKVEDVTGDGIMDIIRSVSPLKNNVSPLWMCSYAYLDYIQLVNAIIEKYNFDIENFISESSLTSSTMSIASLINNIYYAIKKQIISYSQVKESQIKEIAEKEFETAKKFEYKTYEKRKAIKSYYIAAALGNGYAQSAINRLSVRKNEIIECF